MCNKFRKLVLLCALPVLLVVVWAISAGSSVVIPSIPQVLRILLNPFAEPDSLDSLSLAHCVAVSVCRVAAGFLAAAVVGVPLGLIAGRSKWLEDFLSPVSTLMMAVSPIAWMPISIVVFGLSSPATLIAGREAWRYGILNEMQWATMAVVFAGAMFPVMLNTIDGVRRVRLGHLESARLLGASRRQIFLKVIIPSSLPSIMTGLRMGSAVAWRVIIAAELFPATRSGLGYMISTAHQQASYDYAFAAIIVIAAIGLTLELTMRWLAVRVGHWQAR